MLPELSTPGAVASSVPLPSKILDPDFRVSSPLVDWESGGVAIGDASQGHFVKNWRCYMDGVRVMVQADADEPVALFSAGGISELSLAFDQAMHDCVAYTQAGVARLRWYDTLVGEHVITEFAGARNMRVTLDDKRPLQIDKSDIIVAYLRGNALYVRQQRERFATEYLVRDDLYPHAVLRNIGMNLKWRLQFDLALDSTAG